MTWHWQEMGLALGLDWTWTELNDRKVLGLTCKPTLFCSTDFVWHLKKLTLLLTCLSCQKFDKKKTQSKTLFLEQLFFWWDFWRITRDFELDGRKLGLLFKGADVVYPGSFFYWISSNLVPAPYKLVYYEKMTSQPTSAAMKSRPIGEGKHNTFLSRF